MTDTETETDLYATRLEVNVYPADGDDRPILSVNEEEMEQVEELIKQAGFRLSEDSYEVTRLTPAFVTTEENMAAVREVVEGLRQMYPEHEVEFSEGAVANNMTRDLFPGTQVVSVDRKPDPCTSDEASDDGGCADCGGELIEADDSEEEYQYCSECGLIVEEAEETPDTTIEFGKSEDWRSFDAAVERSDVDFESDIEVDRSPPEGEVVVGIVSEPYRTEHRYYRVEDAAEFFGDAWEDNDEMARLLSESDLEPFEEMSLPRIDWVIPS